MSGKQAMSDVQPGGNKNTLTLKQQYDKVAGEVKGGINKLMTANDPAVKEVAQQVANSVQKLNDGLVAAEKVQRTQKDKALREKSEMQAAGRRVQAEKDKALRDARRVKQESQHAEIWAEKAAQNVAEVFQVLEVENKKLSERAVDADVFSAKKAIRALFNTDINHEVLTKPPLNPRKQQPNPHTQDAKDAITREMQGHQRLTLNDLKKKQDHVRGQLQKKKRECDVLRQVVPDLVYKKEAVAKSLKIKERKIRMREEEREDTRIRNAQMAALQEEGRIANMQRQAARLGFEAPKTKMLGFEVPKTLTHSENIDKDEERSGSDDEYKY